MKTIVISGAHSNIGKTSFAAEVLRSLPDWSALKVTVKRKSGCPRRSDCRVCSEFKGSYDIVTAQKIINQKGTDTARLKEAGAKKVVWLKSTLSGLKAGLKKALYQLKDSKGIVIEGTSVLRYIKPDVAIYLKDSALRLKAGAKKAQKEADIIVDVEKYRAKGKEHRLNSMLDKFEL